VSDVRARVPGILLKRLYKEGTEVKEGQPLFQIDPAPLQAALDAALAAQAQAQATATNAHVAAARARELVPSGLVSRSDLDNAEALERSSNPRASTWAMPGLPPRSQAAPANRLSPKARWSVKALRPC
jgi:multidrug efflux pump subunit AcrA (membrane-fusion protein)